MPPMRRGTTGILLAILPGLCLLGTAFASSASAAPVWKFEGAELIGSEAVDGVAVLASFDFAGTTNVCKETHYSMTISNSSGQAKGSLNELLFTSCSTDIEDCTIEGMEAEAFPWPLTGTKISSVDYIVFKGVKINIYYTGPNCVLNEFVVEIEGCAGALHTDLTETFAFNPSTFKATGCKLSWFGETAYWNGVFTTAATEWHMGEALTLS
jgi:hypothetical protein